MAKYGRGFGCFAEGAHDPAGGTDLPMEEDGTKAGMELLSLQEEPLGLNRDNLRRVRKRKRALAHKLPPKPPPPPFAPHPPPDPPCSAASTEFLWRLPRLPWPRVANHMPPIPGPTHKVPRSKHTCTNCRIGCSHIYVQEHIDLLTPSLSQREKTTAPAQCAKA